MPTIPFQTAVQAAANYNRAYGRCIAAVIDMLKKSRLDYALLNYDILEPRCYNVSNTSGETCTALIVKVVLDKDSDTLTAYDDTGTEFPLGSDEDGQDNYTLVNPDVLVRKVESYVKEFQKKLIAPKEYTGYHIVAAVREFLAGGTGFRIDDWFMRPSLEDGSKVVEVTAKEVRVETPSREEKWIWFKELRVRELRSVATGINDYLIYLHNKKTNI